MNDEQIVGYVKRMIVLNLEHNNCIKDAIMLQVDETNEQLLAHIKGVIELFEKAKEILEANNESRQSD